MMEELLEVLSRIGDAAAARRLEARLDQAREHERGG